MSERRITVVASELLGRAGTGGAGTADSLLAVALGRNGHRVELLIATGREIGGLSPEWTRIYDEANVTVRVLEPMPHVRPSYLARPFEVFQALREQPPDVVVANDWRGLSYAALRSRELGRALTETAFVIHCHGPSRMLAEFAHKVPDRLARFGQEVTERASIQLADAVVSPSAWLLDWMRARGWPVPENAQVIQYIRQSAALARDPVRAPRADRIRRVAFFGQLREGKGVRIFLSALHGLEPRVLEQVDLLFLGRESRRWTAGVIEDAVGGRVRSVRVEGGLDRDRAIAELVTPGTLAVMPSLLDNSPNTVSECIEHGVPFVATKTGGIAELVAEEDRARVLCEPRVDDLAAALRRALGDEGFAPAGAARDGRDSVDAWLSLVESVAPPPRSSRRPAARVAVVAAGEASGARARLLANSTRSAEVDVIVAASRGQGLARAGSEWVVFLDDDDLPDDEFLDELLVAQASSDADVVTAGVRTASDGTGMLLFLGDPGALGLAENQYGVVGLVRTELAAGQPLLEGREDPEWPLFAGLALAGAKVVSIPESLSAHTGRPGHAADVPGEGLDVLAAFEERGGGELAGLPQLAATLAAANERLATEPPKEALPARTPVRFARRLLRTARRR
jgi:glycosyltransferase involved in cell wall biosynthesis